MICCFKCRGVCVLRDSEYNLVKIDLELPGKCFGFGGVWFQLIYSIFSVNLTDLGENIGEYSSKYMIS